MSQRRPTIGDVLELTAAQADAMGRDGSVAIVGDAGTGKTTVLRLRYLQRARHSRTGRVLVLCRNRAAAEAFRRSAVRDLAGGFDALAITTIWALAFDIVLRHTSHGEAPLLLRSGARRHLLTRLLSSEAADPPLWPSLHPFVGRTAFVDAVERGLAALGSSPADAPPGGDERWAELAAFADRFRAHCEEANVIDPATVVHHAATLARDTEIASAEAARFDEILVDDVETATPASAALLRALGETTPLVLAANPGGWAPDPAARYVSAAAELVAGVPTIQLHQPFRQRSEPELVECRHPSIEPEAIAGELLAGRDRGLAWNEMAVITPAGRIEAIARALARHNVPATVALRHHAATDPLTRGIVDLLGWAAGDDTALPRLLSSPLAGLDAAGVRAAQRRARAEGVALADLPELAALSDARAAVATALQTGDLLDACHEAFRQCAATLVRPPEDAAPPSEQRSLDAAVAFLRGLEANLGATAANAADAPALAALVEDSADREIDFGAWWGEADETDEGESGEPALNGVAVVTVAGAAGREWPLVIVAGCVEGVLPRLRRPTGLFDSGGPVGTQSTDDRLREALDAERRRFATACNRATSTVYATAAPEPGVLVSRFVASWPRRAATLPLDSRAAAGGVPESEGVTPVWPTGSLLLSASQLDTYEDCPLKYAYRYAAGVRSEAGLHADLGTVVHDALARFLDPNAPVPCTYEALLDVADSCWRDDIAPYRPQVEEARRDYYDMLDQWWEAEGRDIAAGSIEVLATEHPFEVQIGPHRITGRIDRVDRAADGAGIRVLDYKTGKSRPRPDDVAVNIQLAAYHLAARRDDTLRGWGEPNELRLLYVRSMHAYDQEVTADHEAVTEARVLEAARRILAEEFEPSADADCDHCEFRRLCPLWPEGLEVGDR